MIILRKGLGRVVNSYIEADASLPFDNNLECLLKKRILAQIVKNRQEFIDVDLEVRDSKVNGASGFRTVGRAMDFWSRCVLMRIGSRSKYEDPKDSNIAIDLGPRIDVMVFDVSDWLARLDGQTREDGSRRGVTTRLTQWLPDAEVKSELEHGEGEVKSG